MLILTCDNNSEQCPNGTTQEYTINEDGTLSKEGKTYRMANQEVDKYYKKVNESELQVLKK